MWQHTDVTFELPQLLRPSAISSETLWCHKFHQDVLQDMFDGAAGICSELKITERRTF